MEAKEDVLNSASASLELLHECGRFADAAARSSEIAGFADEAARSLESHLAAQSRYFSAELAVSSRETIW